MTNKLFAVATVLLVTAFAPAQSTTPTRPRASDLGLKVGILPTGPLDAITDVAGMEVGQTTIIRGENIRTGVTAVLPHSGNLYREKVPGAIFVGWFRKAGGVHTGRGMGDIETPILLTSTTSVPRVADALISYMLALPGNEEVLSVNPVVGETNDGYLSDIRGRHITPDAVTACSSSLAGSCTTRSTPPPRASSKRSRTTLHRMKSARARSGSRSPSPSLEVDRTHREVPREGSLRALEGETGRVEPGLNS